MAIEKSRPSRPNWKTHGHRDKLIAAMKALTIRGDDVNQKSVRHWLNTHPKMGLTIVKTYKDITDPVTQRTNKAYTNEWARIMMATKAVIWNSDKHCIKSYCERRQDLHDGGLFNVKHPTRPIISISDFTILDKKQAKANGSNVRDTPCEVEYINTDGAKFTVNGSSLENIHINTKQSSEWEKLAKVSDLDWPRASIISAIHQDRIERYGKVLCVKPMPH